MPATHLALPSARAQQVRRIAQAKGISIPELFAEWIETEITKGIISNDIPGIELARTERGVLVEAPGCDFAATIAFHDIPVVAELLRNLPGTHACKQVTAAWNEKAAKVFDIVVTRRGHRSVWIERSGGRVSFNRVDARAFADQLENAAAENRGGGEPDYRPLQHQEHQGHKAPSFKRKIASI